MSPRKPRARPEVVSRSLGDDEWALFDPATERVHALNLSAAVLWEYLDGTRDADALARVLREHFPGARDDQLDADVRAALARFEEEGLLEWG